MGQKPGQDEDEEGQPAPGKRTPVELWLLQDCCIAQLMQPGFAADAVNFMVLEVNYALNKMLLTHSRHRTLL